MKANDIIEGYTYVGKSARSELERRKVVKIERLSRFESGNYRVIYEDFGLHLVLNVNPRMERQCNLATFAKWAKSPLVDDVPAVKETLSSSTPFYVKTDGYVTDIKVTSATPLAPKEVDWNEVNAGEAFTCDGNVWLAIGQIVGQRYLGGKAKSLLNVKTLDVVSDYDDVMKMNLIRCNVQIFVTVT